MDKQAGTSLRRKAEIEDNIFTLLNYSRVFAGWALELRELFNDLNPEKVQGSDSNTEERMQYIRNSHMFLDNPATKFMTLQINLYFLDALLAMHSILFGKSNKDFEEWGLPYLSAQYHELLIGVYPGFDAELDRIQQLFISKKLRLLRHKYFAHNDIEVSSPISKHLAPYNSLYLKSLCSIGEDVRSLCSKTFDLPYGNDPVGDYYVDQFKWVKTLIMKQIDSKD
jgi:hypothetical protein